MQAKSIDFYGTGEIDEGMCAPNVGTDELPGQVDFHNTWQDHDSRFTTFDPPSRRNWQGKEGTKKKKKKIQWSKWRDKSERETVLIMEAGLNVTGWEQSPLNLWYPYMTDEMVWNTGAASCRPLVNTFCHELVLHKQPFWGAVDPCKVLKIFFHHFSLKPQVLWCLLKTDDVVLLRVKDSFEIQSSGPYRQITAMKEGRL